MTFFIFVTLIIITVLLWKLTNFIPDLTFQITELQSDLAAIRSAIENRTKE
ncbi:MAG: hypothetical protein QGD92_14370 [Gammaproteobacteria bacterium]|nr:hypothetical protein [Gammaproteobacteria bacterium]